MLNQPLPASAPAPSVPASNSNIGVVTFKSSACDYFIVASASGGYALLEWLGGWEADRGDQLAGTWSQFGFTDIYDVTAGASEHVWVENYGMSQSQAVQEYGLKCQ